ncbi:hypothetical protein COV20_01795 [Candidatus Woesearchaeota archaeon CG10_big_fil_rev_8_21_14_0_10_45_16]|nr:MAG: hypothetical protein COV20_01795 [Candidatus Woesearchaeota archaeon CG10_big_fil_rev_8_21_14_0_10_45_16]
MPAIQLLDEDLINKIAAGEVIERPASVVKELVENSLDAGASRIIVHIEDCGKKLIKVADNGHGMEEEDAKRSILRHATSKIRSADDLFNINTLGFRGEALASIAAVSQLSLITKQAEKMEGFNLVVEGGLVVSSGIIAAETGTSIEVRNLFYNTPARKKFLKTDAVELRHIIDVVTYYSLLNPAVSFRLVHEKHTLIDAPAVEDLRSNIASIYGIPMAKDLLDVYYETDEVKVRGFIGKPYQARNDKNQQALFINGRWVKNADVGQAVYDGFHSLLFHGKHPIYILKVQLDPEKIDVNVHPQKSEVKIEQREQVMKTVTEAVRKTLEDNNLIPIVNLEFEEQMSLRQKETKYSFEPEKQTVLKVKETAAVMQPSIQHEEALEASYEEPPLLVQKQRTLPELTLFGQIHKTFFVAETTGGVFFIDQHAAHERVLYEAFMEQFMDNSVQVQSLLQGEVIELSPADFVVARENLVAFKSFGFQAEEFGENSIVLKSLPSVFGRLQPKEAFLEFISALQDENNSLLAAKETIITRMACRAAVMAGDELTLYRMQEIINDLGTKEHPYTCPHGRPTIIKITADELEKKFRRKG